MIGVLPLRKPSPFAYPGTAPGVNPTHPACRKFLRFSGVARGANFLRVDKMLKGTVTGTITGGIDGVIGPYAKNANTTARITFAGNSTVAATSCTQAAIIVTGANGNNGIYIWATSASASNVPGLGKDAGTNKLSLSGDTGTPNLISSIVLSPNTPYFVAASYNINGSGNVNFVATNLATGQITTATVANTFTSVASNGTYCINGDGVSDTADQSMAAVMYSTAGLSMPDLVAWANDPWSFWYPSKTDLGSMLTAPSSATPSLSFAVTEPPDVAAFATSFSDQLSLAATEAADTAAFTLFFDQFTLAATENPDVAAFSASFADQLSFVVTETADVATFSASFADGVVLAATEAPDVAAFTVSFADQLTLAATETADTAAFAADFSDQFTLAATETADVAAFTASFGNDISVSFAVTEPSDVAAFSASFADQFTIAATETPDVATFVGNFDSACSFAVTEAPDVAAFSALFADQLTLATTEAPDVAAFAVSFADQLALAATEPPDVAAFTGDFSGITSGFLAATETPDVAAFLVNEVDSADGQTVLSNHGPAGRHISKKKWLEILDEMRREREAVARPVKKQNKAAVAAVKKAERVAADVADVVDPADALRLARLIEDARSESATLKAFQSATPVITKSNEIIALARALQNEIENEQDDDEILMLLLAA